jgi:superoxide dismutase
MNEKLRLQKSNDEQKIDGLGFENYVQAEMLKQVAALPDSLVSRWAKNHDANKNMSKTKMRQETEENEDMMNRIDAEFGSKEEFIQTVVEFRKNQGNQPPSGSDGDGDGGR